MAPWPARSGPADQGIDQTSQLDVRSANQGARDFTSEKSQVENLHQDSSLSQQDRRAKMMDIRNNTNSQVRALLDPTQQKKWDEMQAKREQRMQNHGGSGQQAPPLLNNSFKEQIV